MVIDTKALAIEILEIAEANLLHSFLNIRPEDVHKQAHHEVNSIMWILGHCMAHFHLVLCRGCQENELLSSDIEYYFRFGTTKQEISETGPPMTFQQLVDKYLQISTSGFNYLRQIENEDLDTIIFPEFGENLLQSIQRIALHYMGHAGQIVLIRRVLGNPGPSFVGGISSIGRDKIQQKWNDWWSSNKAQFEV